MIKKSIIILLVANSIGFAMLTCARMIMPYSETDMYFDGVVTLSRDAILSYTFISSVSLLSAVVIHLIWKKKDKVQPSKLRSFLKSYNDSDQ